MRLPVEEQRTSVERRLARAGVRVRHRATGLLDRSGLPSALAALFLVTTLFALPSVLSDVRVASFAALAALVLSPVLPSAALALALALLLALAALWQADVVQDAGRQRGRLAGHEGHRRGGQRGLRREDEGRRLVPLAPGLPEPGRLQAYGGLRERHALAAHKGTYGWHGAPVHGSAVEVHGQGAHVEELHRRGDTPRRSGHVPAHVRCRRLGLRRVQGVETAEEMLRLDRRVDRLTLQLL
mmetsp:Transcript_39688/g.106440  ORF Transcript_39688/g.106440 Transcript_39688/m.106440 type:complete len:241 (+) Transcript_39688:172-894(+)